MNRARAGVLLIAVVACTGPQVAPAQDGVPVVEPVAPAPGPAAPVKDVAQVPPVEKVEVAKPELLFKAPGFMFVFRGDVALATRAEQAWGVGKPRLKKTKRGLEGRQDVDAGKLPAELRALEGSAVVLYGPRGKLCEATLKGLSLVGLSERGDEEDREDDGLPSMPALMAGLTGAKGSCAGALWARRADLPAPVVFAAEAKPDAALVTKVRAATEALAGFAAVKASFAEYARETGEKLTWDGFVGKHWKVEVWAEAGGARRLVVAQLGDDLNIRCDVWFTESFSAVFMATGDELKLLSETGPWRPTSAFVLAEDGAPWLVQSPPNGLGGMLIAATRTDHEPVDELRFPSEGADRGCPEDDAEP